MTTSVNPYTSQSVSGYNASPPTDDGAQTPANQITWVGITGKIGDPLNTFAAAVDAAITTFGSKTINTTAGVVNTNDGDLAQSGMWGMGEATATLGASGDLIATKPIMLINPASTATKLQRISSTSTQAAQVVTIRTDGSGDTVHVIHLSATAATATGANLVLAATGGAVVNRRLENLVESITFQQRGSLWYELGSTIAASSTM